MTITACGSNANEATTDEVQEVSQTGVSEESSSETVTTAETATEEESTTEAVEMQTIYALSKITYYDGDGNLSCYEVFELDDNGNAITETWYDEEGEKSYIYSYEYDAQGNQIKSYSTTDDGSVMCWISEYDSAGTLTHYAGYLDDVLSGERYFDSYGNETNYINYDDDDGSFSYEIITNNEYDDDGKLISITSHFSDEPDLITEYIEYEYDDNGNCVLETSYNYDNTIFSSTEREYDEAGNLLSVTDLDYSDGSVEEEYSSTTQYSYDSNGNQIGYATYYLDGRAGSSCEYEYTTIEIPVD
jgi:hypothetical protein